MAEEHSEDFQKLLARVEKLTDELARTREELTLTRETVELVKQELLRKDQIIAGLQHRLFGAKSERHHPDQTQLDFGEDILGIAA